MIEKQKGYTLVEVIIIVAIMAILSGMSFITIGVIQNARCSSAVTSFQGQLSTLWVKTKAISQATEQASSKSTEASAVYPLCMMVERVKTAQTVSLSDGTTTDAKAGSYLIKLGYVKADNSFEEKESGKVETILSDIVTIRYDEIAAGGQKSTANDVDYQDKFLIQFNKSDGSVKYGAGTYEFIKKGSKVAKYKIVLDASTGKHYIQ